MTSTGFRTDYRLWATVGICLFVALGFLDPMAGAWWKGDESLWHQVGIMVRGEHAGGVSGALPHILFYAGLLSVPAALVAWVLQAAVVVARAPRRDAADDYERKA